VFFLEEGRGGAEAIHEAVVLRVANAVLALWGSFPERCAIGADMFMESQNKGYSHPPGMTENGVHL